MSSNFSNPHIQTCISHSDAELCFFMVSLTTNFEFRSRQPASEAGTVSRCLLDVQRRQGVMGHPGACQHLRLADVACHSCVFLIFGGKSSPTQERWRKSSVNFF